MAETMAEDRTRNDHADRTVSQWMACSEVERNDIEDDIAGRMDLGLLKVGEIVRDLEPYVVDGDLPQTAKALRLIVQLLNKIQVPMDKLDVHALVDYFCKRLEYSGDILNYRAGIKESTEALIALANMNEKKKFPPGDAGLVVKAVFAINSNGRLRDQRNTTRATLFQLLDFLMATYEANVIKNVGKAEFVQGVVGMAELEKDPSCLKILFGIYIKLGKSWALSHEEALPIWESFIRYFPITLTTPSKDPSVPKPEELKSLLLACIISRDSYVDVAFPRLIDMLDTSQDLSANVKKDVFDTMAACVTGYSLTVIFQWATKIWDSLKFEIWNGENEEFILGSLRVINALACAISRQNCDWDDEENGAAKLLFTILKECVERVVDSKQRFMLSTGRILYAIASASPYTFSRVAKKTLPALLTLWEDLSYKEQTPLLAIFNSILQARIEVGQRMESTLLETSPQSPTSRNYLGVSQAGLRSALSNFKERLVEQVYWKAMTETPSEDDSSFRIRTIQGLVLLTRIPGFLLDFEQGTIISSLNKIALDFTQSLTMREEAVSALQKVSMHDPARFSTITLPNFLGRLPDHISTTNLTTDTADPEVENVIHILDYLKRIACSEACSIQDTNSEANFPAHVVFDAFQGSMLKKLFEVLRLEGQFVYAQCILISMSKGLKMFDEALETFAGEEDTGRKPDQHPYAWIVLTLYQKLAVWNLTGSYIGISVFSGVDLEQVEKVISQAGQIATLALRSSQTTPANNFLNSGSPLKPSQVWSLFIKGAPGEIDDSQMDLVSAPTDKHLANILSMSLVAAVGREEIARLRFNVANAGLSMVQNVTSGTDPSPFARITTLQFLQLLVNKFGASSLRLDHQDLTLVEYMQQIVATASSSSNNAQSARIYQTLSYFTAASIARCDKHDSLLVDLMIEGISHPTVGSKVARCFRLLLSPSEILTKENFCIIRPLRFGRLYNFAVDKLNTIWRTSHNYEIKSNALISLAGVLEHMDPAVYIDNAASIIPLLLEGTNVQNDDSAKLACINIIRNLVPERPEVINSHLDSVINRMTDRTRNTYYSPSDANADCRSAAIDVLSSLISNIEEKELVKRKPKVITELDVALDDCNSMVRLRAVGCKLRWFNLGTTNIA